MEAIANLLASQRAEDLPRYLLESWVRDSLALAGSLRIAAAKSGRSQVWSTGPSDSTRPRLELGLWRGEALAGELVLEFATEATRDAERPVVERDLAEALPALLVVTEFLADGSRAPELDLRTLLEDIVSAHAERARSAGLEFFLTVDPQLPGRHGLPEHRLREVLTALLCGVFERAAAGHVAVHARLREDAACPLLELQIEHSASSTAAPIALAPASLEGLSGACLAVRPRHPSGTIYTLRLALDSPEFGQAGSAQLAGRALLLDPDPDLAHIRERALQDLGLSVTAPSSLAAAADPARWTYDLAILHPAAFDSLEQLQQTAETSACPIVYLTPRLGDLPQATRATGAVADWPLMPSDLLRACRAALSSKPRLTAVPPAPTPLPEAVERALVLVVEDDPTCGHFTSRLLQRLGLEAHVATDGSEALRACEQHAYSLILMDCDMPNMDGLEATRALRALERTRELPIVALTGKTQADQQQQCLAVGMNDFLTKPMRTSALRRMLGRWLPAA